MLKNRWEKHNMAWALLLGIQWAPNVVLNLATEINCQHWWFPTVGGQALLCILATRLVGLMDDPCILLLCIFPVVFVPVYVPLDVGIVYIFRQSVSPTQCRVVCIMIRSLSNSICCVEIGTLFLSSSGGPYSFPSMDQEAYVIHCTSSVSNSSRQAQGSQ